MERSNADAAIGLVMAIIGGVVAMHLLNAAPPVEVSTPAIPQPEIPTPDLPSIPEIKFNPPQFLAWLNSKSSGIDLAALSPEQLRDAIGNRVYKAVMQTPEGTGICASFPIATHKIATAYHCATAQQIEFRSPDDTQVFYGQLVWSDPANDSAVYQVDVPLKPFKLAQAQAGEPAWAFGYPMVTGARLTVTPTQVTSINSSGGELQVPSIELPEGTYYPGNSGGPLLNQRGEAIGLAHAITKRPPYIGFAIPSGVLPR